MLQDKIKNEHPRLWNEIIIAVEDLTGEKYNGTDNVRAMAWIHNKDVTSTFVVWINQKKSEYSNKIAKHRADWTLADQASFSIQLLKKVKLHNETLG